MLSQTAAYALRAVLYLARQPPRQFICASRLARSLDLPHNYLSKILHQLSRAGILSSTRGPRGGFRLAVPPAELSLLDVASCFDRITGGGCLLRRPECDAGDPCPVLDRWNAATETLESLFGETTVADLVVTPRS